MKRLVYLSTGQTINVFLCFMFSIYVRKAKVHPSTKQLKHLVPSASITKASTKALKKSYFQFNGILWTNVFVRSKTRPHMSRANKHKNLPHACLTTNKLNFLSLFKTSAKNGVILQISCTLIIECGILTCATNLCVLLCRILSGGEK